MLTPVRLAEESDSSVVAKLRGGGGGGEPGIALAAVLQTGGVTAENTTPIAKPAK